jgi:kynurenine 3-monooxygenase
MNRSETSDVAVVGGGLVGSLLAALVVDRGYSVTVYERRPDVGDVEQVAGRSINLVVTRRGIRALEQVGLAEAALRLTIPVRGRMMHSVNGELTYQPYGRDDSECNYSISRAGLNAFLISEAEKRGVRFRFDARLADVDLVRGRLSLESERDGSRFEADAPVVFGADGAGSVLRGAYGKLDGFRESIEMLDHGYKELLIPAREDGEHQIEKHALHIWPRGEFMLMALPNIDGSFTVTLYLPNEGRYGFNRIDGPEWVVQLFHEHFPDAIPLIPDLTSDYFANPTGNLGTVRCNPWHFGDRALLIGDAAHAIVPFFGQGMNSGFEDCTVLGELMDRHGRGDWGEIFSDLTAARKPDSDAIADMALENFVEMRDHVGDPTFLLRKQVEHRLEREIPSEYRSRYSMVMYSHIPFRIAFEAGRIQRELLEELCANLGSANDLDVEYARCLIGERLTPLLRANDVSLDY